MRSTILFSLNGRAVELGADRAGMMLAEYLREQQRLVGTKVVCDEGDCGACTVLKAAPYHASRSKRVPRFLPVNSCIISVAQLDGSSIVTVEALRSGAPPTDAPVGAGSTDALTPVQRAMVHCHASQCGFCTPGFVMALTGLVEKKLRTAPGYPRVISAKDAKNATTGNLCRCTGYQPIIDAAVAIPLDQCQSVEQSLESAPVRRRLALAIQQPVLLDGPDFRFFAPTKLAQLGAFLEKHPSARILAGATDLGVVHNKRKQRLIAAVSLHLIPELHVLDERVHKGTRRLRVGARVTLSEVRDAVKQSVPELASFLDLFASPQIKNQGTLVGNLANASPIGDTSPFLLIAGTTVEVYSPIRAPRQAARRSIPIEQFFLGYRVTALAAGEVITAVEFDLPSARDVVRLQKVSQRTDLDISTVCAAIRATPSRAGRARLGRTVTGVRIAFGGVAATPLRFPKTEHALEGRLIAHALDPELLEIFQSEMTPMGDLRGSSAFRRVAAENLLRKYFRELALEDRP